MIEVYLYGDLRRYASESSKAQGSAARLELEVEAGETVGALLQRLGIPPDEIFHAFLNAKLLSTRNSMGPWLGYQQVQPGRLHREPVAGMPVQDGDRLALFARDMALLIV